MKGPTVRETFERWLKEFTCDHLWCDVTTFDAKRLRHCARCRRQERRALRWFWLRDEK